MPISSSNTIATNYKTELMALRAAQVASYFTVGSKDYIGADQLVDKRNGKEYGFVVRDRGQVVNALASDPSARKTVEEREVKLAIEPWHIYVKTDAVEEVTDLQFDKEVAEIDGKALIQGALKKSINKDVPKSTTAFVGELGSFEPLALASGHLQSITDEPLYAWVNPDIQSVVTSKGAQFVPVQAPAMYRQGLIGEFHGADYRAQRFLKSVRVSKALADAMDGAVFASFTTGDDYDTLRVTFGTSAASATKVKAGTPFFIEGVVATDLIGDETDKPYAFVALEDADVASGAAYVDIKVNKVDVKVGGTRTAAMEDGEGVVWSGDSKTVTTSTPVTAPAAGLYLLGLMRANGAYQFSTLPKISVSNADSKKGSVEGITVFQNRRIDIDNMVNDTRFDTFTLAGTVENRAQSLILCKVK